jgi:DNA-binding NarL/FixJ family response regulator
MQAIQTVMHGQSWVGREAVADMPRYLKKIAAARPYSRARSFSLTRRETEVLAAIVEGLTNRDIAAKFALSEDTVKHHLTSIFDKLDVTNRLELALFAINNRLLEE